MWMVGLLQGGIIFLSMEYKHAQVWRATYLHNVQYSTYSHSILEYNNRYAKPPRSSMDLKM